MEQVNQEYLQPTSIIDSDHETILNFAHKTTKGVAKDPIQIALKLYYAVRDGIRYDPYMPFSLPEHYRASHALKIKRGFCIPKACLLCALARALNIPARLGFATVKNHLATRQLIELQGSERIVYHGYAELFLEGKWVIATPAFNAELCNRHHVPPLEFNGREDSQFQPQNLEKKQFMEYLEYHGSYADVPIDKIMAASIKEYGADRVQRWQIEFQTSGGDSLRDFYSEDVVQ